MKIQNDDELQCLLNESNVVLGAYANRLKAVDLNWTLAESTAPQPFRNDLQEQHYWNDFVKVWIHNFGIQLVGGCCGITPEHIAYIQQQLQTKT